MKSNFWKWREYKSRHHRLHTGKAAESWGKPLYFDPAINEGQFRQWLRQTLGISYTEHLETSTEGSERDKENAKKTFEKSLIVKPKRKPSVKRKIIKVSIFDLPHIIKESLGGSCAMPRR